MSYCELTWGRGILTEDRHLNLCFERWVGISGQAEVGAAIFRTNLVFCICICILYFLFLYFILGNIGIVSAAISRTNLIQSLTQKVFLFVWNTCNSFARVAFSPSFLCLNIIFVCLVLFNIHPIQNNFDHLIFLAWISFKIHCHCNFHNEIYWAHTVFVIMNVMIIIAQVVLTSNTISIDRTKATVKSA